MYHRFYGSLRIDIHESMILHMVFPVCNSYSLFLLGKFCLFSKTLVKSYVFEIFSTLCLLIGLSLSSLILQWNANNGAHRYAYRWIDSLLPTFIDNASMNIFIHSTFICGCLTSFHKINSQKCNYWVKGWGYFKSLNIWIVNLAFKRIVWVKVSH